MKRMNQKELQILLTTLAWLLCTIQMVYQFNNEENGLYELAKPRWDKQAKD